MKPFHIRDEVRKQEGKEEYTFYKYKSDMEFQANKRYNYYKSKGYKVNITQTQRTSVEIVLV